MQPPFIYLSLLLVIGSTCLIMYGGSRLLAATTRATQNWLALVCIGLFASSAAISPANLVITNFGVLSVGLFAGMVLSRRIASNSAFIAFLIAGAIADLVSAQIGPTRWFMAHAQSTSASALIQYLAFSLRFKGHLVPLIGVGDLMFFAVSASATRRFGWPESAVFTVPLTGILTATAVGLTMHVGTPALPFLAISVLVYSTVWSRKTALRQETHCRG